MLDVLSTLSRLVKAKKKEEEKEKKAVTQVSKSQKAVVDEALAEVKIAQAQAREILVEAKDEAYRIRREAETDTRKRLELVDRREVSVLEKERFVKDKEVILERRLAEVEEIKKKQTDKLERAAHLTCDEAKKLILEAVEEKLKEEIAKKIKEAEIIANDEAEEKAKQILVDSMCHGATDYVAEYSVSVVPIEGEDMKGRIIGKEGRNIRAFETATGVDVDLDEEGVIRLSSFDPVRREVAKVALKKLLRDGRVQPVRIEEIVAQVKKEIERIMFEEGQKLCHAVNVYNLPSPLIALLGRFKYRFSYGQNMITHTLEETKIGVALAHELKADVNIVKLGCLLHDIGKVITDKEGNHIDLGVELLRKYQIPARIVDCVAQHHEDTPFTSVESVIVYISDAVSGGRPGARYEDYEEYIKRLSDLESIAKSHEGVKEAFAIQAGRELRVIVDPGSVDDSSATVMAQNIKEEIEKKITYPGQIKISVIRELRAVETAM